MSQVEVLVRHDILVCDVCGSTVSPDPAEAGGDCHQCEGTLQPKEAQAVVRVDAVNIDADFAGRPEVVEVRGEAPADEPASAPPDAETDAGAQEDNDIRPLGDIAEALAQMLPAQAASPVHEIAAHIDARPEVVAQVLDEYQLLEDGTVAHVGPGKGGGWVEPDAGPEPRERKPSLSDLPPEEQLKRIDQLYDSIAISEDQRDRLKARVEQQMNT